MFDVGSDFPANQVTCYSGLGFAERQILFSEVKLIHGGSGVTEHAMVTVSPLLKSVEKLLHIYMHARDLLMIYSLK